MIELPTDITTLVDSIGPQLRAIAAWGFSHPDIAAPIAAFLASYVLYGVLGKRSLGADDDYWERIRGRVTSLMDVVAKRSGGYVRTTTSRAEFAGYVRMTPDAFERKLQDSGYLRQPLASMHYNEQGWQEDGSWARSYGPLYPAEAVCSFIARGRLRIPVLAEYTRRFLKASNTVLALKQRHIVFYVEDVHEGGQRIHVYCHSEWNPLNPLTAALHYAGGAMFRPTPEIAREDLKQAGVSLNH